MRRITLRSREEARRDVEREQYHPSYPPGLLYSAYPMTHETRTFNSRRG
jgi:hypothetical protein